jgi:hypothetical protein
VKSAFLIPECKEEIYIRLSGQYSLPDGKVLRLHKMLYGLKNSAFVWNEDFTKWMNDHRFTNVDGDGVTFVKIENQRDGSINKMIVTIHVDDGIVYVSSEEIYEKFIVELQRDFVLRSHGKMEWYLGCKIIDMEKDTVTINQEKYAHHVLHRFNIQEDTPVSTPYESGLHLIRYIVGTANLGLTYRKSADGQQTNKLNTSADADDTEG